MNEAKIKEQFMVDGMNIKTVFDLLKRTREELQTAQNRIAQLEQHAALMDLQIQQVRQNPLIGGGVIGSTGPR